MEKLPNAVYSWNARGTAVQCPRGKATVLTLCSVGTVQDEIIPAASPSKCPVYSFNPVKQSLETLAF